MSLRWVELVSTVQPNSVLEGLHAGKLEEAVIMVECIDGVR